MGGGGKELHVSKQWSQHGHATVYNLGLGCCCFVFESIARECIVKGSNPGFLLR